MTEQNLTTKSYIDRLRLFGRDAKLYILSGVATSLFFGINSVLFNLYLLEVGFAEDFIGFFMSVSLFATAAIAIFAGTLTDRMSRKKVVIGAGVVSFLAFFIQYTILDPASLLLSQVFLGISSAFVQVAIGAYITDLSTDEERAHLFGVNNGLSLLGVVVGNLLGGFLPRIFRDFFGLGNSLAWAYRYSLWFSLIPYLLSIVFILPMTPDPSTRRPLTSLSLEHVRNWGFIGRYAIIIGTVGLGAGMIIRFFNIFFQNVFGVSSELMGIIFGINTVVLSLGSFIAPALSDRLGKVRTIVITEILSIPFLLMLSWSPTLYIAVIAYVSRTALMNMAGPVSQAFFMENLSREERSTASGIVSTLDAVARGIAANIAGWLLANEFYRLPYLLVSGLYVAAVVMFFMFFRNVEVKKLREMKIVVEETEVDVT